MKLQNLRNEIDFIDKKILVLLNERFQISKEIADFKNENGMDIFQPERENELFDKLKKYSQDRVLMEKEVLEVMEKVVEVSRKVQSKN